jgi:nucleoside-diphosphate-sugar epimerase
MSTDASERLSGKRLVIFGAGYIGGAFARQACSAGVDVVLLTRNAVNAREFAKEGMHVVVADLADDAWHRQIEGGADWVVNCVSGGGAGIEGYRHSYLEGMRSLARWLKQNPAGTTVYTSSTSVYPQDGGVRVDEQAEVDRIQERPRVLVETEDLLRGLPESAGRRSVLRLAGIYGPGRHHLLEQVREGEVSGHPGHHLNLIHRDDICTALWRVLLADGECAREANGEVFNVADDGAATKVEVVNWLAERMQLPPPVFTGVAAPGRRMVTPDRIIDNARIKRVLGWSPKHPSFREGYAAILGA